MFRVVIYIAVITLIPVGTFFLLPASVKYHVTEKYSFSATQASQIIKLAVMLPKDNAYQKVDNVQIEWDGEISKETYDESEVIRFESDIDENKDAILEYDVVLIQGQISWGAEIKDQDTLPQKDIESDETIMVNKANEICKNQSDNTAYETYKFTADHLSWPKDTRIGASQSALTAYESQIGVCGEFANLMTALNRACNNPARSISGLSMPLFLPPMMSKETLWMHPGGAHGWVEVFDKGKWTVADPSWASSMPLDSIWFGRSQGQYLSYGETGAHDQIFAEMLAWGEESGEIIGAMSAPVKFVASSEDKENTTITPIVSVKKVSDVRWLIAVSVYIVIIAASSVVETRMRRQEKFINAANPNSSRPRFRSEEPRREKLRLVRVEPGSGQIRSLGG